MTVTCDQCYRSFVSDNALHNHCSAKADHPYCDECERLFRDDQALQQHLANAAVHQGDSDEYESDESDEEVYCGRCDRYFGNASAFEQHRNTAAIHQGDDYYDSESEEYESDNDDDDDDPYCESCNRMFVHKEALYQHLSASSLHNWCFICSKDFRSPQALSQHDASRVHKVADIKCPLCPRQFKSPSDIAGHIEAGGCNSRIDRHHVTAAVHALKLTPTISITRRIAGPAGNVTTTYAATELAYNGHAGKYECYLCHHQFGTLSSLNTHLVSPAHDAKQFKCPNRTCGRQFTVISALIRHIESEACGLAKFSTVKDYTHSLTSQFSRMLTL
ncbi:hypothetical protein BDZ89DRAFT_1063564 [Hymenopellis radicata]|nr:hypothetical protein BDZ89DRAFT_1063564 [Hymenopellis radicata]